MLINYRATSVHRAYVLNALVIALIALVTVEINALLRQSDMVESEYVIVLSTLIGSFITAMLVYYVMYGMFNFGGGMLAPYKPVALFKDTRL